MFGGGRKGGITGGLVMAGGGWRGGIPGLSTCMIVGLGRVITGVAGDPSWLTVPLSEEEALSPLESSVDSSGVLTLPAAKQDKIRIFKH